MQTAVLSTLRDAFRDRLQEDVPLAGYTSARIGGPVDAMIFTYSSDELAAATQLLWKMDVPFIILGTGANILVSDQGFRGAAIINRARLIRFNSAANPPTVWVESGVTLNDIAQRAARLGLTGFEWASTVPGTVGGAIYGNAGAFGGDMAGNLVSIDLIHRQGGHKRWPVEKMIFQYRSSILKRERQPAVIMSAELKLQHGETERIREKMTEFSTRRRNTQPPGASMGSMFKNPPGDFAGRLIEAAGLKGTRMGNAEISNRHANFFINLGNSKADDVLALIKLAKNTVFEKYNVTLELEIELVGEWQGVGLPV